jgi:acetyl esterase/lipase
LSAHPNDPTAFIAKGILKHCPTVTRSFSIEYRLSKAAPYAPQGAFPSALIDALAGYDYLVNTVGFDPKDIILEGDSAGGNLALALVRYLTEYGSHDPTNPLPAIPGALILLSPWADMGTSHIHTPHTARNAIIDYLGHYPERAERDQYVARAFTANMGTGLLDNYRYCSPGSTYDALKDVSFKGYPKTFITSGGLEMLFDQIETLQEKMKAQLGQEWVTYYSAPEAIHDWVVIVQHEPERSEVLQAIAGWLSTV